MTHRLASICAALTAFALSGNLCDWLLPPAAQEQDVVALDADIAVERHLVRGEEHRYTLQLDAGEYAGVVVDQQGVDVIVQIRGIDGKAIAEIQDEVRKIGREQVEVVATIAGTYTLAVFVAPGNVQPGGYEIRLDTRRPATDADRAMQSSIC
jgi:hypothetical protein